MAFIDTPRFPDSIACWGIGGRGFNTTTVQTYGGIEYRNSAWLQPLGEWEFSEVQRVVSDNAAFADYAYKALRDLHKAAKGQLNAFRFKDFLDCTDEGHGVLVTIDGTHKQLAKTYTVGGEVHTQNVLKPISPIVVTGGGSVDYATGIVTGGTPTAWTGSFDIPVRFLNDIPMMGRDSSGALIVWSQLKLLEVRLV